MADTNQPAWRGNAVQRFGRGFVDRVLPGNQRAPDGTLQNVGRGFLGLGVRTAGGLLGPGGAVVGGQLGANVGNHGLTGIGNFDGNNSRLANGVRWLGSHLGSGGAPQAGPGIVPRMPIPGGGPMPLQGDPTAHVSPLSLQLNAYRGAAQGGVARMPVPGAQPQATTVRDANWTPTAQNPGGFRGANGQMVGGTSSPGGLAAGIGRGGAGVIEGDAARDMFASMRMAGVFGNRQTGTDASGNTLAQ